MLRSAAVRKSLTFFLLKSANTALATLWSFLLAYSLVRIVGLENYAFFATVIAFASLILQADLGISIRLFGRMRQDFLHPGQASREDLGSAAMAALWSYAALAVLATLLFGLAVWAAGLGVEAYRPVYVLLFLGSALPLPWMILRVTANAFDAYVMTETIDFIRRSALFGLTLALLAGLPLMAYSLAFVALWLAGLAVLFALARRRVPLLAQQGLRARRGFSVLRQDLRGIAASAQLSISEFLIYIFPYYAIPLMHRDALALVAFDMFYKVTRFATTAYLTVSETLLPHQTRAWHAGDRAGLWRTLRLAFLLGLVPMLGGAGVIGLFGEQFFGLLLGQAGVVTPAVRVAICVMLVLMLVQTLCGAFLAATGFLAPLARRASLTLAAMLGFAALTAQQGWTVEVFIGGYVALYGCEALSYLVLMIRTIRRQEQGSSPAGSPIGV